jgi:putative PEP-CTERM system TPR-repeat lipoprotein
MVRIFTRALTASFFAVVLLGCDGNLTADQLVKRAEAHRAEGKPRSSLVELKNAVQKSPENVAARVLLADISLQIGDPYAAERELLWARDKAERAVVEPDLAKAWLALGKADRVLKEIAPKPEDSPQLQAAILGLRSQAYIASGRLDEAETELVSAAKADASAPEVLAGQAQLAWRKKDLATASKLAGEAAKAAPRDLGINALNADILLAVGDAAAAEQAWSGIAKLSENSVPSRVGIARAELAQKKLPEAIKELDAVLKASPRSAIASHLRGLAAYQTKDYAGAKAYSEKALSVAGDYMPSVLVAGASSYALEQYEQANRYLQRYIAEVPGNVGARKLLAQTQIRLGRGANAVATLKAGLKENPQDVELLALVGTMAARTGDLRAGGNYLQQAVALAPDDPRLRARLGMTKIALGEKEGVDDLEKAIEIDPTFTQAEVALIVAELRSGKFQEALDRAKRLQESADSAAAGYFFAGAAHAGLRQLDLAEADYQKALELRPGNVAARTNLAMLAAQRHDFDLARQRLTQILKDNPDRLDTMLRLAMIEQATNHQKEAAEWLERAVAAHPDTVLPRLYLSRFKLLSGDPAKALEVAGPALERFPKEPSLLEVVGQAQLALGRAKDAVATFGNLAELRPEAASPQLSLAKAYAALGDATKQQEALEKALAVQPKDFAARSDMARFSAARRDFARARPLVDQLLQDFPNNPAALDLAGDVAIAEGKPADAVKHYEAAWKTAPSTSSTVQLARARWLAGEREVSVKLLEGWIGSHQQDAAAKTLLAAQYIQLKRLPEAKTQLASLIEQSPNSPMLRNDLAWVLYQTGDLDAALAEAKHANEAAPDSPAIKDTLGMILLARKETAEGLALIRSAAESAKNDPAIRYHYALALSQSGDVKAAREILVEVLNTQTKFDERAEAEALLKKLGG